MRGGISDIGGPQFISGLEGRSGLPKRQIRYGREGRRQAWVSLRHPLSSGIQSIPPRNALMNSSIRRTREARESKPCLATTWVEHDPARTASHPAV